MRIPQKIPKTKDLEHSDTLFGNPYNLLGSKPLRFVCMNCRKQHNERKCPNCGSGAVKVE